MEANKGVQKAATILRDYMYSAGAEERQLRRSGRNVDAVLAPKGIEAIRSANNEIVNDDRATPELKEKASKAVNDVANETSFDNVERIARTLYGEMEDIFVRGGRTGRKRKTRRTRRRSTRRRH